MADLSTPFCELKDAADRKGYLLGLLRFAAASSQTLIRVCYPLLSSPICQYLRE